jgi:hypothetical protein
MADDVVDTIAQYDLDDDFPDYANEQNKELNQIVSSSSSPRIMGFSDTKFGFLAVKINGQVDTSVRF